MNFSYWRLSFKKIVTRAFHSFGKFLSSRMSFSSVTVSPVVERGLGAAWRAAASARFGSEKELTVRYGWSPTTRRGLSSGAGAFLEPFDPEAGFEVSSLRLGTGMITGLTFDGAAPVFVSLTEAFV